jgi:rhamnogalacturonan endolyase
VDGDGRDEVVIGSAVVDDNGNGLWTTGFGHPDFCFVGDIDPAHPGLEIFYGIEPPRKENALCLVDAKTGKLLWGLQQASNHVGDDGMCADVDDRYPGSECYAADLDRNRHFAQSWLFSAKGELLSDRRQRTMSQPVYWDADPQRELLRDSTICDFGGATHPPKIAGSLVAIADVIGDWREEIITSAPGELRIYTTTIPATSRRICLMQDPIYRIDVAVAAMGYYAAPMLSYDMASRAP